MVLMSSKVRGKTTATFVVWPFILLQLLTITNGSPTTKVDGDVIVYTFGKSDNTDSLILSRILYSDVRDEPRNLTIVLKLFDELPRQIISFVELRVNSTNPSKLVDSRLDLNRTHSMELSIRVPNSRHVSVTMNVYRAKYMFSQLLLSDMDTMDNIERFSIFSPSVSRRIQSFVVVHVQKTSDAEAKSEASEISGGVVATPKHYNTIGRRQSGDRLLHFRSMNVTNLNRFAEREIEFVGDDRQAFTCVGFVFDSPTAVAYLNSSFVRDNQIAAILYDLNAPHFIANMSVFGYNQESERPVDFRPLLTSQV